MLTLEKPRVDEHVSALVYYLISAAGPLEGRARLVALAYLTDLETATTAGVTSGAQWIRHKNGPLSRDVVDALDEMDGAVIAQMPLAAGATVQYEYARLADDALADPPLLDDPITIAAANRVLDEWSAMPLSALLAHVWATEPFANTPEDGYIGLSSVFPGQPAPATPEQERLQGLVARFRGTADHAR